MLEYRLVLDLRNFHMEKGEGEVNEPRSHG